MAAEEREALPSLGREDEPVVEAASEGQGIDEAQRGRVEAEAKERHEVGMVAAREQLHLMPHIARAARRQCPARAHSAKPRVHAFNPRRARRPWRIPSSMVWTS